MNTLDTMITADGGTRCFVPKRFMQYFRLYVGTSGRRLLWCMLGIFALMVMMTMLPELFGHFESYADRVECEFCDQVDPMLNTQQVIYSMTFLFAFMLAGTMTYSTMQGKMLRLETLQVPASSFEKALTYFLIYTVAFVIAFFGLVYLVEIIRVAAVHIFAAKGAELATIMPLRKLFLFDSDFFDIYTSLGFLGIIYGSVLINQAIFVCGGIYFYRFQFILTAIFIFFMGLVCSMISGISFLIFAGSNYRPYEIEGVWLPILTIGGSLLLYCGLQLLAYYRFKQTDLVNKL